MKKTWGAVKSECINLGFEKFTAYQKNPSIFVEAVNRAMVRIAGHIKPILGKYVISQYPLQNAIPVKDLMDIQGYRGVPLQFFASGGKSYYFESDGIGTATISNGTETKEIQLDSNRKFKAYRGFMDGDLTITFSGPYAYNIRNVAIYRDVLSDKEDDIPPYSRYIAYDIAELTKEDGQVVFMDFANDQPVQSGAYNTVEDYKKYGRSTILLNHFDVGEFTVWYKKYPKLIQGSTPENYELELDYDAADLIPLFAAYYIWLDDDKEKATYYLNMAIDRAEEIIGGISQPPTVVEYENTTGWW
jgi:hypothetical protein